MRRHVATVAINMRPTRGPWGGSSIFVSQLEAFLRARGYKVTYTLDPRTDIVLLIDPRKDLLRKAFGTSEIEVMRRRNPRLRVVHRVNECDQRKGTDFMDRELAEGNRLADHTVFIARWLRDYHCRRWFDERRPHSVIYNGAPVRHFHPVGSAVWADGEPLRIVTHHWSNNELKGFDAYRELDGMIAKGTLPGVEFHYIGRYPTTLQWKATTVTAAQPPHKLAPLLRSAHLYVTASRWEPCGMHHVEGAQCGLPLLFHTDGGGIVEAGEKYGIGFGGASARDLRGAIAEARIQYAALRANVLTRMPSGDRMCLEYAELFQMLLAGVST